MPSTFLKTHTYQETFWICTLSITLPLWFATMYHSSCLFGTLYEWFYKSYVANLNDSSCHASNAKQVHSLSLASFLPQNLWTLHKSAPSNLLTSCHTKRSSAHYPHMHDCHCAWNETTIHLLSRCYSPSLSPTLLYQHILPHRRHIRKSQMLLYFHIILRRLY